MVHVSESMTDPLELEIEKRPYDGPAINPRIFKKKTL